MGKTSFLLPKPGVVRLWLSVYEEYCPMGRSELWTKLLYTNFAPREGDTIHLWPDEDGDSSVGWTVCRNYWSWDGLYNCELTYLVVNPSENNSTTGPNRKNSLYARAWNTEVDGRPEPGLRRGYWITWKEYNEQKQ